MKGSGERGGERGGKGGRRLALRPCVGLGTSVQISDEFAAVRPSVCHPPTHTRLGGKEKDKDEVKRKGDEKGEGERIPRS